VLPPLLPTGRNRASFDASKSAKSPAHPPHSWAGTRTPDLTIMRPVQDDGGEPENVADAGERADPADAQMRFDFD
jgi:hypothetical protein